MLSADNAASQIAIPVSKKFNYSGRGSLPLPHIGGGLVPSRQKRLNRYDLEPVHNPVKEIGHASHVAVLGRGCEVYDNAGCAAGGGG
jgi:hypothetical protein